MQKMILLMVSIFLCTIACFLVFCFSFPLDIPIAISLFFALCYASLVLSERRSEAFLSATEFKISKGYFFGIVVLNKSYLIEEQNEIKEFLAFIDKKDIQLFGIPLIDELTNTKITFIREELM
ncbi:MAG: hypothetical protein K6T72_03490 [Anoxybacillus sp.]|nr:hypothetical protein [Anoxybacillus sp.]MCL6585571.1 hypothetical protein [Anoxybacillus sp.]